MSARGPTTFNPLAVAGTALDTPLARILAERIQVEGPITFRDWMDACLYHPEHGYYRSGRPTVGRDGDFLTSPEVHPLFGAAVGHVAASLWQSLGRPRHFRIAEVGPGSGALAESILRHVSAAEPRLTEVISYTLVEPDRRAAESQQHRLASFRGVTTAAELSHLQSEHQLVVANELLDAVPVHLLRFGNGRWRERYVNHTPERGFHFVSGELSSERLLAPLRDVTPAEGQLVEVAPQRGEIVSALGHALAERGLLLLFDYGYSRDRLYASWRRDGTLMTFRRHVPGDDPLAHPGEQDITAHIDIDQVHETAAAAGLTALPVLNQAEWLHQLGAAVLPAVAEAQSDTAAYLAARRAAETLTDPAGLGRVAVIGLTRGELPPLPGWEPA